MMIEYRVNENNNTSWGFIKIGIYMISVIVAILGIGLLFTNNLILGGISLVQFVAVCFFIRWISNNIQTNDEEIDYED